MRLYIVQVEGVNDSMRVAEAWSFKHAAEEYAQQLDLRDGGFVLVGFEDDVRRYRVHTRTNYILTREEVAVEGSNAARPQE